MYSGCGELSRSSRPMTSPWSAASSAVIRWPWNRAAASRSPRDCGLITGIASACRNRVTASSRAASSRRYRSSTAACSADRAGSGTTRDDVLDKLVQLLGGMANTQLGAVNGSRPLCAPDRALVTAPAAPKWPLWRGWPGRQDAGMATAHSGHTHRLDLVDATVREWDATVIAADPEQGIVLDRSAFYPGGGGQPPDEGVLLWGGVRTRIAGTRKGDELYLIPVEGDPVPPPGTAVRGALDDERRTQLMRTHSGLHVLTGVVFRDFGALVTGGNMEPLTARMDFDLAEVPPDFKERVAESVNAEIAADRPIEVTTLPAAEAFAIPDIIRTATNVLPPDIEQVRIVDIVGLDTQADGGTHVASTSMVGRVEVVKMENKGRGFRRLRIRIV